MLTKRLALGLPLLTTACALFDTDPELRLNFAVGRKGDVAERVLRTPQEYPFRFLLEVANLDQSPEGFGRRQNLFGEGPGSVPILPVLRTPVRLWVMRVGASADQAIVTGAFEENRPAYWSGGVIALTLTQRRLPVGDYTVRAQALADIPGLRDYRTALLVQVPRAK